LTSHTQNIEISERRLDHDHVRAFFEIQLDFAHRFPSIGRVHLVAPPVAELWGRLRSFPKWSIKTGGVLGSVRKNRQIRKSSLVEGLSDPADTAIHHVRRGNDISAGPSMRYRR